MKTDTTEYETNGRKTLNAALVTLSRVGVIASIMMLVLGAGMASAATWVVDNSGGADFTSIQAAVDAASEGDTIEVRSGTYNENVAVDKRVTLVGDGADVVTVRSASSDDNVFLVTADYVSISGFTVTWACYQYAGIYLNGVNHCNIYENTASGNTYGIYLEDSSNNTLASNTADSNDHSGIWLDDSSNNVLASNIASSNDCCGIYLEYSSSSNMLASNNCSNDCYGIYLYYSSNNTLASNMMSGNTCNFGLSGSSLSEYTQNIDTSNTVDGKPIYYWVDQKDKQIPSDAGFVGVVNGTNITVRDLTLTNNSHGVLFAYTENSRIENVTASNNYIGIQLEHSSNNTLTGNTADSNNYTGIRLDDSSNNTLASNNCSNDRSGIWLYRSNNNMLANNTANSNNYYGIYLLSGSSSNILTGNTANSNNYYGIHLSSSSSNMLVSNNCSNNNYGIYMFASWNNMLHHNNLAGNAQNAYDTSSLNHWDSGSEGNYYSDYIGTDSDGDGIGDISYLIPGGWGVDRFPLMQPWAGDTPQKGDLNSDGSLTPADAVIALEIAVGSRQCDDTLLAAADVSGDTRVTSLDALMILQAAAGAISL